MLPNQLSRNGLAPAFARFNAAYPSLRIQGVGDFFDGGSSDPGSFAVDFPDIGSLADFNPPDVTVPDNLSLGTGSFDGNSPAGSVDVGSIYQFGSGTETPIDIGNLPSGAIDPGNIGFLDGYNLNDALPATIDPGTLDLSHTTGPLEEAPTDSSGGGILGTLLGGLTGIGISLGVNAANQAVSQALKPGTTAAKPGTTGTTGTTGTAAAGTAAKTGTSALSGSMGILLLAGAALFLIGGKKR